MYQIDQSLKFLLPIDFKITEEQARRNIKIYNWFIFLLILSYIGTGLWIFFTPIDVGRVIVLLINLSFRLVFLTIYLVTVYKLYQKIKFFNMDVMDREISSIKRQFLAFFVGFIS